MIEMQRRRLLFALGEVLGEGGLEAVTVGRVCARGGVSRRTFYELFADREACLLAAFESTVEQLTATLAPVYKREGRWGERVRGALTLLLERFDADPDLARLCVVETPRAGPEVLESRRRVLEALASIVDEGRGEVRAGVDIPPLTAQGIIGGVFSVVLERLLNRAPDGGSLPLAELTGPLMAMIVYPYLGSVAAKRELERSRPATARPGAPRTQSIAADPFRGLSIRFTYRTARVLATIASEPGASNRHIADHAGIADEGQTSRLLARLRTNGLIENQGQGHIKGEPNAWELTPRGQAIHTAITMQTPAPLA